MDTMILRFSNLLDPFLSRAEYTLHSTGTKLISVRGKTSAAFGAVGTFQWTSAVQAMSLLMLRTALTRYQGKFPDDSPATIAGDRGTLAASLDYCISKSPLWLLDMFGTDSRGLSRSRRLFLRNNPERKRGGEVTIAVNPHVLEAGSIRIFLEGQELVDSIHIEALALRLEQSALSQRRVDERSEALPLAKAA